jgi:hypothetical protein
MADHQRELGKKSSATGWEISVHEKPMAPSWAGANLLIGVGDVGYSSSKP